MHQRCPLMRVGGVSIERLLEGISVHDAVPALVRFPLTLYVDVMLSRERTNVKKGLAVAPRF